MDVAANASPLVKREVVVFSGMLEMRNRRLAGDIPKEVQIAQEDLVPRVFADRPHVGVVERFAV
jgi:hypothetical protein